MFQTGYIADNHRTKKTRGITVAEKPRALKFVLDRFRNPEICERAFERGSNAWTPVSC